MLLTQLEYNLPENLIAHSPSEPRDSAKLLVLDRNTGEIIHKHFFDLPEILTKNDVLVLNDTKVFPARLHCAVARQARTIEILLLREVGDSTWSAMHKGKVIIGEELDFGGIKAIILDKTDYEIAIQFNKLRENVLEFIEKAGQTPLPPYIHSSESEKKLREKYQTVFARNKGSVAAPTAGMHFTRELIEKIKTKGVQVEYVTLHVGAGTFLPIKSTDITKHKMHSEYFSVDKETVERLNSTKTEGKRIIAVGTTTTRVLESGIMNDELCSGAGETKLFILPPYKFKFVDSLITNFHLPHSTLLALVSAFVSSPNTEHKFKSFKDSLAGKAYEDAIANNYKFYSFGDGMLIV